MRRALSALILLGFAHPLAAQESYTPIIPSVIAHDLGDTRISVTVDRGLTSSKRLRSTALRNARTAMHEGGGVSAEHLRALAEAGDGLAAQRYVRLLEASSTPPGPSDLAYFSAISVGTGRVWTLKTMIAAMHDLDPKSEPRARINKYIQVLYPHAWAGNPLALEAVLAFNGEGRLFGALSDRTRDRILAESREHGDGRIELGMALSLLERTRAAESPAPGDLSLARSLLKQAEISDHLAVRASAQNLLRLMDTRAADGG